MPTINAFALTASAILQTFFGDAPIEIWFPLLKDIIRNTLENLSGFVEVLM